jgi:FlaA1/EpsC-like NDP-sugar epimerase
VNLVREVDIEDLLGRDPVSADPVLLSQCIKEKAVLVTGAGGSIGSELCRQILAIGPSKLVLIESNEGSLFNIHRELAALTSIEIIPCLGSITNRRIVATVLREHQIQTIYHAAAHKHVPLIETNLFEGIRNNVLGTLNLAQLAFTSKVETFVLISTDKAVRPSSVMGATKRCAELIIQNLNQQASLNSTGQRFCAVRFGNVLGSSGSVVPIFKEQIAHGGPITVTHPEVTRYFMSIHEAVELVIQAGSMAKGGEIFLLDMGEPVKILDLARKMVKLAGLTLRTAENPAGDIEIITTGLRPGEKLYEELLIASEGAEGTSHPKILKGNEPELPESELYKLINLLRAGILYRNPLLVRESLFNLTDLKVTPDINSVSSFQGSDIIQ